MNVSKDRGKTRLNVGGRMSEKGADRAGIILSIAALATGLMFGVAAIIAAISYLI